MTNSTALKAVVALGALMAANGFVLGPMWLFGGGETFVETAASWAFAWSQRASWVLLMLLIPVLPALLGPRSLVSPLVQVGFAAQSATAFAFGFVLPWVAEVGPELLAESVSGGTFYLAMMYTWIASSVVTVVLAVALNRARSAGRLAPVLLGFGALAVPGAGPVGWGIIGLALALTARRVLRSQETGVDIVDRVAAPEPA